MEDKICLGYSEIYPLLDLFKMVYLCYILCHIIVYVLI